MQLSHDLFKLLSCESQLLVQWVFLWKQENYLVIEFSNYYSCGQYFFYWKISLKMRKLTLKPGCLWDVPHRDIIHSAQGGGKQAHCMASITHVVQDWHLGEQTLPLLWNQAFTRTSPVACHSFRATSLPLQWLCCDVAATTWHAETPDTRLRPFFGLNTQSVSLITGVENDKWPAFSFSKW